MRLSKRFSPVVLHRQSMFHAITGPDRRLEPPGEQATRRHMARRGQLVRSGRVEWQPRWAREFPVRMKVRAARPGAVRCLFAGGCWRRIGSTECERMFVFECVGRCVMVPRNALESEDRFALIWPWVRKIGRKFRPPRQSAEAPQGSSGQCREARQVKGQ